MNFLLKTITLYKNIILITNNINTVTIPLLTSSHLNRHHPISNRPCPPTVPQKRLGVVGDGWRWFGTVRNGCIKYNSYKVQLLLNLIGIPKKQTLEII